MGVATPDFFRGSQLRFCPIVNLLPPPALLRAAHSQSRASPQGGGKQAHFTVHSTGFRQWHDISVVQILRFAPDGLGLNVRFELEERANRRAASPFDPGHVCSPPSPALALGRSQLAKPNRWLCLRAAPDHCSPLRGDLLSGGTLQHTVPLQHRAGPWAVETAARSEPAL